MCRCSFGAPEDHSRCSAGGFLSALFWFTSAFGIKDIRLAFQPQFIAHPIPVVIVYCGVVHSVRQILAGSSYQFRIGFRWIVPVAQFHLRESMSLDQLFSVCVDIPDLRFPLVCC